VYFPSRICFFHTSHLQNRRKFAASLVNYELTTWSQLNFNSSMHIASIIGIPYNAISFDTFLIKTHVSLEFNQNNNWSFNYTHLNIQISNLTPTRGENHVMQLSRILTTRNMNKFDIVEGSNSENKCVHFSSWKYTELNERPSTEKPEKKVKLIYRFRWDH